MVHISKRQKLILQFIQEHLTLKGYAPSVREITDNVGLASVSTTHGHLDKLEKKGIIRKNPTKPRTIKILNPVYSQKSEEHYGKTAKVPVLGKVSAGEPITAIENIEEYIKISETFQKEREKFILRVEGDSMVEAAILDGDHIIVSRQNEAANGEIVVAMTEDNVATVKRFFRGRDYIQLQPENPAMDPLILPDVRILGKVIGVFRNDF